jgi:hypothetical protein
MAIRIFLYFFPEGCKRCRSCASVHVHQAGVSPLGAPAYGALLPLRVTLAQDLGLGFAEASTHRWEYIFI